MSITIDLHTVYDVAAGLALVFWLLLFGVVWPLAWWEEREARR